MIDDKFSNVPNRQARFYLRKREDGRCIRCGNPRDDERLTCSRCRNKIKRWKKKNSVKHPRKSFPVLGSKYDKYVTS
jgi:predicted amidophosphoribosyltransferase